MSKVLTEKERTTASAYVAEGLSKSDAYRRAYSTAHMNTDTVHRAAHRLFEREHVKDFVEELHQRALARHDDQVDKSIHRLACIAYTSITDVIDIKDGKVSVKDMDDIPHDAQRAIECIEGSKTVYGAHTKVKLFDKIRAIELLGRHFGMWDPDRSSPNEKVLFQLNFGPDAGEL